MPLATCGGWPPSSTIRRSTHSRNITPVSDRCRATRAIRRSPLAGGTSISTASSPKGCRRAAAATVPTGTAAPTSPGSPASGRSTSSSSSLPSRATCAMSRSCMGSHRTCARTRCRPSPRTSRRSPEASCGGTKAGCAAAQLTPRETPVKQRELARFLRNWRDERDSAALYRALAALERNPRLSRVFARLAEAERQHSAYWEQRLHESGQTGPKFRPSFRARLMMQLARQFGVAFVVPSITTRELADHERYSSQEDASAAGLSKEERGHAAVMRRVATYGSDAAEGEAGESGAVGQVGNNLRAAVLGANDGLASNFCLLMGVAGGAMPTGAIVLTGVAGLVAGACSMALGEWLSVTNAREMARSHTDTDAR